MIHREPNAESAVATAHNKFSLTSLNVMAVMNESMVSGAPPPFARRLEVVARGSRDGSIKKRLLSGN
jgi:hypothetical protein